MVKFKKLFSIICSVLFVLPLTSCSSVDLYNQNYSVADSTYTPQIMNKTVCIEFDYSFDNKWVDPSSPYNWQLTQLKGTGWIWKVEGNDYYIATNLHVAAPVTFLNNQFFMAVSNQNSSYYTPYTVSSLSSKLGFYNGTTIIEEKVDNPVIVYSTISDSDYNNAINPNGKSYPSLFSTSPPTELNYWGISDICILKYSLDPSEYKVSNPDIYNWLTSYNLDPTIIYGSNDKNAKSLNLSNYVFYSGGFPSKQLPMGGGFSTEWVPVSGFKLNTEVTKEFGNGWANDTSDLQPITFIDPSFAKATVISNDNSDQTETNPITRYNDETDTNFLNTGYTGYFYGHSSEGASGSLLATIIDNEIQVVGIYWGVSEFLINNETKDLGCYDIFVTSKYNIAYDINQAIQNDINNNSQSQIIN